jgi:hypothetical protein
MNSPKNTRKNNLQPIWNKNLPQAHTELEFDMFGVPKKLIKNVIHSCVISSQKEKLVFFANMLLKQYRIGI